MNKSKKKTKYIVFGVLLSLSVLAGCNPSDGAGTGEHEETHQHSFSDDWSTDANQHWHACNGCTEKGSLENHQYGEWDVLQDATYEAAGSKSRTCIVCNYVETVEIPVKQHNFSTIWETDGTQHWHKCTDAGFEELTTTKEDHDFSEYESIGSATIFTGGEETRTCKVCGYEDTRTTDPIDIGTVSEDIQRVDLYHSEITGAAVKAKEATKVIDGVYTIGSETYPLANTGGDNPRLSLNGPANTDGTRTVAFKVNAPVTMYISVASRDGANVTFGVFNGLPNAERTNFVNNKTYSMTSTKNDWFQFDVPAAGLYTFGASEGIAKVNFFTFEFHVNRTQWMKDANYHWHELSCGVNTNFPEDGKAYADKAEHTWNNGVVTKPATCTEAGVKTYTCTVCEATKTESISALTHSPETAWDYDDTNHWHNCANEGCNEKLSLETHEWGNGLVTTPATTETTGVRTFTCKCGKQKTEVIPVLTHTPKAAWEVTATHHWHECQDSGCDEKIQYEEHNFDSGVVTTAATCSTDGVKTYTCQTCLYEKTEVIPASHTLTSNAEVAPKCDGTNGIKAHDYCSVCGKYFVNNAEVEQSTLVIPYVDKYHSSHDFDGDGVCKDCGIVNLGSPYAGAKTSDKTWTLTNLGKWGVETGTSSSVTFNENSIFVKGGKSVYCRLIPNADIKNEGGVFYASFDLIPQNEQVGCFKFGSGTTNEDSPRDKIDIQPIGEAEIGKTYHLELIIKLQAGKYWQLSFQNDTGVTPNANLRCNIENIKLLQLTGNNIPDTVKSGINIVSYPTEWTPSVITQ